MKNKHDNEHVADADAKQEKPEEKIKSKEDLIKEKLEELRRNDPFIYQ
jgi:hypothetical protein